MRHHQLADANLADRAKQAAGNWRRFDSFAWSRQYDLDRPEDWAIVYTSNRDSGLLDQSNAAAIANTMEPFTEGEDPDAVAESHNHWACSYVDGYSIRVYHPETREITPAFRAWCEIMTKLEDYPILDESDYSEREFNATLENIASEGSYVARRHDIDLPDNWEGETFSWLWDHDQTAVENCDDQGGYPSEEELLAAFTALGWYTPEDDEDGD